MAVRRALQRDDVRRRGVGLGRRAGDLLRNQHGDGYGEQRDERAQWVPLENVATFDCIVLRYML